MHDPPSHTTISCCHGKMWSCRRLIAADLQKKHRREMDLLECNQVRATKMILSRHLPCQDRLRELGLCWRREGCEVT